MDCINTTACLCDCTCLNWPQLTLTEFWQESYSLIPRLYLSLPLHFACVNIMREKSINICTGMKGEEQGQEWYTCTNWILWLSSLLSCTLANTDLVSISQKLIGTACVMPGTGIHLWVFGSTDCWMLEINTALHVLAPHVSFVFVDLKSQNHSIWGNSQ